MRVRDNGACLLLPRWSCVLVTVLGYGVNKKKVTWVKNAIDAHFFSRVQERGLAFRDRLKIPRDAAVVGAVGRLNAEKDYPNFLDAAKLVLTERSDVYFTIAGKGPLEESLQHRARSMGLADRVRFLGHFHDVREVYEAMDVYVLSSLREGLPNVVLEAMAMEVPLIATRIASVPRVIEDGQNGLLVEPGSAEQLAAAIRRLIEDDGLRERLRQQGRHTTETRYGFRNRMRKVATVFDELLGR